MKKEETATLGGGCFWCFEALFQRVKGVDQVVSGYSGGTKDKPTTNDVYKGDTGHAEVVQLTFDPNVVSYRELLEIFFIMHDPTTLNRQGNDVGDWYRSVIFYHDEIQRKTAEDMIKNFAPKIWNNPIVTALKPFDKFWPAGKEHQDFFNSNPGTPYCQIIINPKVIKLRQKFAEKLKPDEINI